MEGARRNPHEGTWILVEQRQITYAQLSGACADYQDLFRERFGDGDGIAVTVEMAVTQAHDWDWDWAARNLLSEAGWVAYSEVSTPAERVFRDIMEPLWAATQAARERATVAYQERISTFEPGDDFGYAPDGARRVAQDLYNEVVEPAADAETKARREAVEVLHTLQARTFAELYIREGHDNGE